MHRIRKIGSILIYATYAVCGGLLIVSLVPGFGWRTLDVATASMAPAVPRGSMVLVRKVPYTQIKIGDIITYKNPSSPNTTITHRVIRTGSIGAIPTFTTKGDANATPDRQIVGGNVVGKVALHVPYLGYGFDWMRSLAGLIILLIIPGIIIIFSELRRLWRIYGEPEHRKIPVTSLLSFTPIPISIHVRKPRRIDGIGFFVIALIFIATLVQPTLAQLNTHATLRATTISTASRATHMLLSRVALGNGVACNSGTGDTVNIVNSGTGATTNVTINNSCIITVHNSNSVVVNQSSSQNSTTGNVTITNSSTTSSSSGSATNNNTHATTVIINNGSGTASAQWFELYNPTAAPINISGWMVHDNSNVNQTLPLLTIGPSASVTISGSILSGGKIGNGLKGAGDRLILLDQSVQTVDGLSWGTDTTVMVPAVGAIPQNGQTYRINPNYDTNLATDWRVQP